MVGRPPLIGVRDGAARLLQRRETLDDILRREAAWLPAACERRSGCG
jgi:diaminopimelate decarboxylase